MIKTPIRPAIVASQRRTPTFSPRNAIDSAVTNSGAIKPVAEASAIGRNRKPEMKNSDDDNSAMPRITCRPGRSVFSANSRVPGSIAGTMISAKVRNRIQAISIDGSVAERYFAVTSEQPRKTVDARISAMPRNGRSARAGAERAAFFRCGKGNEAASSRAAVAEGGVTVKLGWKNESGEAYRDDNSESTTRHENRTPICASGCGGAPHFLRHSGMRLLGQARHPYTPIGVMDAGFAP